MRLRYGHAAPSPRRFPRRDEPVVLTVRVDLVSTSPPLWRRLELASDLFLDEVHDVLQTVFAWDDSHLHKFGTGGRRFDDRATGYFLAHLVDEEDGPGIPEWRVRLDEVLSRKGDKLFYMYDFGDSWEHVLTLHGTSELTDDTPRAVCTGGSRPSPVDDCGGVPGYEFWNAVNDPDHPHHGEALADLREGHGQDGDHGARGRAPVPLDRDGVNELLATRLPHRGPSRGERATWEPVPEPKPYTPVDELLEWSRDDCDREALSELVGRARINGDAEPGPDTVRSAVAPYLWLLDHLAGDGVELTRAGHPPPASVAETAEVLSLGDAGTDELNGEDQAFPILSLWESVKELRLVRRYRGRFVLTPAGRGMRSDPAALWAHVVERLPFVEETSREGYADLVFLLSLAAGETNPEGRTAKILEEVGVNGPNGVREWEVLGMVRKTHGVLRLMGAYPGRWGHGTPTPTGVAIARTALRRWPRRA